MASSSPIRSASSTSSRHCGHVARTDTALDRLRNPGGATFPPEHRTTIHLGRRRQRVLAGVRGGDDVVVRGKLLRCDGVEADLHCLPWRIEAVTSGFSAGFRRVVALGRLLALGRLVQPVPERLQTLTEVAHHVGQAIGAEDHQGDCACPLTVRAPRSGRWWRSGRWRNCPPRGRSTTTRSCSPLEACRS